MKCTANEELEDCKKRLLKCGANEKLEDCKKRVGAPPPKEGTAGERDAANKKAGDREAENKARERDADQSRRERDADQSRRERDADQSRREREDPEREGGGERQRGDDGAGSRRQRGEDREGRRRGAGFQANKTFGLGLELGEPTGLNGKYFLSEKGALDFGVGLIYGYYYYGDGLHLYADYLYHPISLVSASAFKLPLYIGGGLRFWDFNYCAMGVCDFHGSALGIRIPVGISFDFNNTPLDIFIQLVPVIDFVYGDYYNRFHDRTHLGIDLSVGVRYWFK